MFWSVMNHAMRIWRVINNFISALVSRSKNIFPYHGDVAGWICLRSEHCVHLAPSAIPQIFKYQSWGLKDYFSLWSHGFVKAWSALGGWNDGARLKRIWDRARGWKRQPTWRTGGVLVILQDGWVRQSRRKMGGMFRGRCHTWILRRTFDRRDSDIVKCGSRGFVASQSDGQTPQKGSLNNSMMPVIWFPALRGKCVCHFGSQWERGIVTVPVLGQSLVLIVASALGLDNTVANQFWKIARSIMRKVVRLLQKWTTGIWY